MHVVVLLKAPAIKLLNNQKVGSKVIQQHIRLILRLLKIKRNKRKWMMQIFRNLQKKEREDGKKDRRRRLIVKPKKKLKRRPLN